MNKLSPKITSLIKKHLRKASLSHPARNEAKRAAKIAPSLFECQCGCGTAIYEGSSDKNFEELKERFSDLWILRGKGHIDHINPVREGKDGLDWDDYLHSLFCDVSNLQYLSPACHDKKSMMDKHNSKKSK